MKSISERRNRTRQPSCAIAVALSWALAMPASVLDGAGLPVRQVTLYKHGVAYFEREGSVPAGGEARLDFQAGDMNDVLKSLTVTDRSGNRITGIRYDSNESLDQKLSKYPFSVADQEMLSSFLDRLKGSQVELKTDKTISGTIVSARAVETGPEADQRKVKEQVTVLLDAGELNNIDLATVASIRLVDPKLQEQLKQYLQTLAQSRSKDKRSIYIDSAGSNARDMQVAYISPTAVWKSSYRLVLGDSASTLEGWAIVDNTTDEDWKDVKLSVVSGRPISFISQLDTPRYGRRSVFELPEDQAAGPVVYAPGAGLTQVEQMGMASKVGSGSGHGYGTGQGGGMGGGTYSLNAPPLPPAAPSQPQSMNEFTRLEQYANLKSPSNISYVQGATGATLGELFEYNFAGPVTIKKNQSAMLPFLQDKVAARKLLIYQENSGQHPVNAAEVANQTGKTLDGGPITVYDSGAYAGEALFETVKDGDKRLIGYAVDFGTRVATEYGGGPTSVREIHARNGVVETRTAQEQTRIYTIKNVDPKPKTLIVEQAADDSYTVLTPKPAERTASAYRFEVKLPAKGDQTLTVKQECVTSFTTAVQDATPDMLLMVVQNKAISPIGKKQLQAVVDLKLQLVQVESDVTSAKAQGADINQDQTRLRQNIDSLNRVAGQEEQVRKYSGQLATGDVELTKLRDQTHQLTQKRDALQAELRQAIGKLDF
jgi:hypothetical protein